MTKLSFTVPIARLRHLVGILVSAVSAIVLDLWLRVGVLYRFRRDEARRIAGVNRIQKVWGAAIFRVARVFLGLRVRVEGSPPPSGRYLVVSNHQSSLDIPLLITTLRSLDLKFVAMEKLRSGHLVISAVLRHGGAAFVKKESYAEDLVELTRFGRDVERWNGSPLIFPEGGLARDGVLRPFRLAGIEAVRRAARLPLLPVTVEGLWPAPSIHEYWKVLGASVTVRIGEPIPCEAVDADPRAAYDAIEEATRRNLAEIRAAAGSGLR